MRSGKRGDTSAPVGLVVLLAGLGGGLAEVLWVMVYCAFNPLSGSVVAREVTASLFPAFAAGNSGVWLGIVIHMTLAVALGFAFAHVIWKPLARSHGPLATFAASALTLATVWTANFFVLLPVLHPVFITLMPYPVTFASKMLFALGLAGILVGGDSRAVVIDKTVTMHGSV